MVRIKVIKASHLLFGVAIALLILSVVLIILSGFFSDGAAPVQSQANLVQRIETEDAGAKTHTVFAPASSNDILSLDPAEENALSIEILPGSASNLPRPSILIYHTHTHEAYEQTASDQYVAIEAWRTTDHDHSVVRVGSELATLLRERGFEVVHDTTDHEQNDLKTAYTRSLATLEGYDRSFDLYIDLHRDAFIESTETTTSDEQSPARLMCLIGNGEGFSVKPYYEENLLFAEALTDRINALSPGLCKDVLVKDGRYNQNIGVFSILVEVGHNRNTLHEALAALPYLAEGIESLLISSPDAALSSIQQSYHSE